jgi:hypothetical protein
VFKLFVYGILGVGSALSATCQSTPTQQPPRPPYFIAGADVSFLRDMESKGIVFKDEGGAHPGLEILRHHGYGWVRLRIMNEPTPLPNTLAYTLAEAKAAKALITLTTGPIRRMRRLRRPGRGCRMMSW